MTPGTVVATLGSALLRALAAVFAGLLLVCGLALVLWAVTPGSGADATGLLRAGVAAFAAAHFLPVQIGGVALTLRPLLLTVVMIAVIASAAGRARPVRGRMLEALHATAFALTYAGAVDVATTLLAVAADVRPGLLMPLCVAVVGVVMGVGLHRTAWSRWWRRRVRPWLRIGVRAGLATACVLLAGGALATLVGLVVSFQDATAVAGLTARSAGDGFGLLLMCLAFLPNAVIAGVGYVSGAGFTIGAGTYSPLAVHTTELPAMPLLAAVPGNSGAGGSALAFLAIPVMAAALVALIACRSLTSRRDRLAGSVLASAVAGTAVAGLAAAAGGGVADGPFATTGVSPLLAGGLTAGVLVVVGGTWSAVWGLRTVAWSPARTDAPGSAKAGVAADDEAGPGDGDAVCAVDEDADDPASAGDDASAGDAASAGDSGSGAAATGNAGTAGDVDESPEFVAPTADPPVAVEPFPGDPDGDEADREVDGGDDSLRHAG